MKFILGKKIGMSHIFNKDGDVVPVTLVEAGPCKVIQKKTKETDGYQSVRLGLDPIDKSRKEKKSARGSNFKYIKEFTILDEKDYPEKELLDVSLFEEGDKVTVSGISKGKGFQGGVKRWGFGGALASHGIKHNKRKIGSVGSAFPQRVIKGRKMPGRMGADRVTVKGLKIIKIDADKNIMAIKGAIPGARGTLLEIRG
ncbi:MAG: 50S ribosomal protein L3 [Minisyncoccales bacterium]|jgi:large subunit ribosomal protein L3